MANDKTTLILLDDHPMLREGMEAMLTSRKVFKVLRTFAAGEDAIAWCRANGCPDIIVSDIRMPGMDGFAFLKQLQRFYPDARVIFLAGMPLREESDRAKVDGARGYLSKSDEIDSLAEAIRAVAAEEIDFAEDGFTPAPGILSPRETDVIALVAKGLQRDAIAEKLFISPETVKSRLKSIMQKLDVTNAASAVARAYERGILQA